MLLKIIRLFRGYIVFSISGAFPERFLNMLSRGGIRHWDFIPCENAYEGKMFLNDYLRIRPVARAAKVRLRSKRRVGLPFFVKKYRRRKGLLVGAVVGVIILSLMSNFVWDIKVVGAEGLSISKIHSAFDECGFKVGMLKNSLNTQSMERQIQLKLPEIRWLSINAINNIATVEIKQLAERPANKTKTYPCNIKAECDGVITDIVVSNGTAEVRRGSAVAKNQLLVNSVVITGEKQRYVHSEAKVMADVREKHTLKIPIKKNNIILNKNYIEKSELDFLFLKIPCELSPSLGGVAASNTYSEKLIPNNVTLPLGKTTCHEFYFDRGKRLISFKTAKQILKTRLALSECFRDNKSTVKKREIKFLKDDNSYSIKADYVLNKDIGQKQRLKVVR